MLDKNCPAAPL